MVSFLKLLCLARQKMSYGTSLYDKINFFYIAANFNGPGGYQDGVQKFQKSFFDLFRPRNKYGKS